MRGVRQGSDRDQTGIRQVSDRYQTGIRQGSDRDQTGIRQGCEGSTSSGTLARFEEPPRGCRKRSNVSVFYFVNF